MASLYVSTSGLVLAYKYNMNSMVSFYVRTGGLVPAYQYNMNSMVSLLLELQSFSLQRSLSTEAILKLKPEPPLRSPG